MGTPSLLPVCVDLPILNILHKWNPSIYNLLCLTSFTWRSVFRDCLHCNIYQHFIPFYASIIYIMEFIYLFVYSFFDWHLRFHFLAIGHSATINRYIHIFVCTCFQFFCVYTKEWIAILLIYILYIYFFWGTAICFPQQLNHFTFLPAVYKGSSFPTFPPKIIFCMFTALHLNSI